MLSVLCAVAMFDAKLTPKRIFQKVSPSVVTVVTARNQGSGFVVAPNLVVTCLHVVGNSGAVRLQFPGNYVLDGCQVVAQNETSDLVLVKTPRKLSTKPLVVLLRCPEVGDPVYVIGSPEGLDLTLSEGIVSSVRTSSNWRLQITAPVSRGSSGSPVLDELGRVVGVVESYLQNGQNLNFAVVSLDLYRIADTIIPMPLSIDTGLFDADPSLRPKAEGAR